MGLEIYEKQWALFFRSEKCPPVAGLAPLQDDEYESIGEAVRSALQTTRLPLWRKLCSLLRSFPAAMIVWISRVAGEAYDSGAFWERFAEKTGAEIPPNHRKTLAHEFDRACRHTLSSYSSMPPADGHRIVAVFLYQAGLPLDRCKTFVEHIKKVLHSYEISMESGDDVRDLVLESLQPINMPSLKRALYGSAGAMLCEAALHTILTGGYQDINPALSGELARAFSDADVTRIKRGVAQPYLRLTDDLCSAEVIFPPRNENTVWLLNGERHFCPAGNQLTFPISAKSSIILERSSDVHEPVPPKIFTADLATVGTPCLIFDYVTGRQRRAPITNRIGLPAGDYLILHRSGDAINASPLAEWRAAEQSVSHMELHPGQEVQLIADGLVKCTFCCSLAPYVEPVGKKLVCEGSQVLHFQWPHLPKVWLPTAENCEIGVEIDQKGVALLIEALDDEAGGLSCYQLICDDFNELEPGLHDIAIQIRVGARRAFDIRRFLYWQGLEEKTSQIFRLTEFPVNLLNEACTGFCFRPRTIEHVADKHRVHQLSFKLGDNVVELKVAQPGLFVETLENVDGRFENMQSVPIGQSFVAGISSRRWIRLWFSGLRDWRIAVNDQIWAEDRGQNIDSFKMSLAELGVAFPNGGKIAFEAAGRSAVVASFSAPLQPVSLESEDNRAYAGYSYTFPAPVSSARAVVRRLTRFPEIHQFDVNFASSRMHEINVGGLPFLQIKELQCEPRAGIPGGNKLVILASKGSVGSGVWWIEAQIRRDEREDFRAIEYNDRLVPPVLISGSDRPKTFTGKLFRLCEHLEEVTEEDLKQLSVFPQDDEEIFAVFMLSQTLASRAKAFEQIRFLKFLLRKIGRIAAARACSDQGGGRAKNQVAQRRC